MSEQQPIINLPIKKIKVNTQQQADNDKQWIVIKKKTTPLTISISDHSKVNRFYSHKSIQKYIRYLLTQTCPNPMWLAIKRQSQIQHIYYIDIQIEDYLFEKMIEEKSLQFLGGQVNIENKAVFKQQRLNRYVWDCLLVYDQQSKLMNQQLYEQFLTSQTKRVMSQNVYKKYNANVLTPQQLKENLYPDVRLPLYKSYHCISPKEQLFNGQFLIQIDKQVNTQGKQQNTQDNKNLILVIDCEMVTTSNGFELARCTIINYQQEVIFDEFFKPPTQILNYNTEFSGITKDILDPIKNTIQTKLHPFLNTIIRKQTILVGHSLENDFNAMQFYHPNVVDTSVLFRRKNGTKMKLKNLADRILKRKIQSYTHDSKQDCLATLHLVQAKIQNEKSIETVKQYHLLRDIIKVKKNILMVDYDIENMRQYNSIHFEKTQVQESPLMIAQIIKKYSNKTQVAVPKVIFSRFEKGEAKQWENYYQEIDSSLLDMFSFVPPGSVFFLNFQVNEVARIVPFTKQQSQKQRTRPFLVVLPKN